MSRPTRTQRRISWQVLAPALALVLLTGCSGTADTAAESSAAAPSTPASEAPPASSGTSGAAAGALTVTGVDFGLELDATELTAGDYEIEFVNDGGASHDVRVERDGEDVAMSEVIPPGETSSFSVTLEPGEYVFYCSVGNHRGMGMEVTVAVT